jgi:hypothetical protein
MPNCDEGPMNSSRTITVVRKVYDNVELALWAALLAFVIYGVTCVAPNLPQAARRAENLRALKIAEDNSSYCERWGLKRGTQEHTLCAVDLYELRKRIEQEFADEAGIL